MGRRNQRSSQGGPPADFEFERSLAAAEEDAASSSLVEGAEGDARCTCGSSELLLQAYLRVVDGKPQELVDVETLSCPQCGKEYEAVQTEDGRVLRGEFLGTVDLDDGDE